MAPRSALRLTLAVVMTSAWLALLLTGWVPALAAHLLLAAGCFVFPWRDLTGRNDLG